MFRRANHERISAVFHDRNAKGCEAVESVCRHGGLGRLRPVDFQDPFVACHFIALISASARPGGTAHHADEALAQSVQNVTYRTAGWSARTRPSEACAKMQADAKMIFFIQFSLGFVLSTRETG